MWLWGRGGGGVCRQRPPGGRSTETCGRPTPSPPEKAAALLPSCYSVLEWGIERVSEGDGSLAFSAANEIPKTCDTAPPLPAEA